ncbi:MAG TPA: hypothetical protein VF541_02740 [Longimicrobium sp.]
MNLIPRSPAAARRVRLALMAAALPLAVGAGAGFVAEPPSPASGYVYYGTTEGGAWKVRSFDNLTRRDAPSGDADDAPVREGDLLRARGLVNVRARPWTSAAQEPPVIGALRRGERVVARDVQPVGLSAEFRRMGYWVRYERPPRSR